MLLVCCVVCGARRVVLGQEGVGGGGSPRETHSMAKKKGAGNPSRAVPAAKPLGVSSSDGTRVVFTQACSGVVGAAVWVNMQVVGTIGGVLTVLAFVWTRVWETVVGTAVRHEGEEKEEEQARPDAPSARTLNRRKNRKIAAAAAGARAVVAAEEAAAAALEAATLEAAAAAVVEAEMAAAAAAEAEADEEASSQSSWGVSASTASVRQAGGAMTPPPPPPPPPQRRFAGGSAPASLVGRAESSSEDEAAEAPLPKNARLSASVRVAIPEKLSAGKVKAVYQKRDGQRVASVLGLVLSARCEVVGVAKGSLFGDAGVCKGMTVWGAACEGAAHSAAETPSQLAAFVQRVSAGGGGAATLQVYLRLDVACLDAAAKASTALTEPEGGARFSVLPGRVVPQWEEPAGCVVETQRPLLLVASGGAYTLHAGVFAADATVAAAGEQRSSSGPGLGERAVRAGHRVKVSIRSESGLAVRAQSTAPLPVEHGCCTLKAVCVGDAVADESESESEEEEEEEEKEEVRRMNVGSRRQLHGTSIRLMSAVEKALLRTRFADLSARGRHCGYGEEGEPGPQLLDAWQLHNPDLVARFRASWERSGGSTVVQECFHGTSETNILSILRNGFDIGRRCGQAYGPGEYFGAFPDVSVSYCRGGAFMLVCKVLLRGGDVYSAGCGVLVVNQTSEVLCLPQYLIQFYNPLDSRCPEYCSDEETPEAHFQEYLESVRQSELHQQLCRLGDPRAATLPYPAPVPGGVGQPPPPPQVVVAAAPPQSAYREWEGCTNAVMGVGRLGSVRRSACGTHAVMEKGGRKTAAAAEAEAAAAEAEHSPPCTRLWLGYFRVTAQAGDEAEVSALLAEELERLFAAVAPGGVPAAARMGGSRSGDYVVLPRAVAVDAAEAPAGAGRARAVEASPVAFVQEDVAGEQVAEALVHLSRGVQPEELLMVNALLAGGKVHAQKGRRAVLVCASAHGRVRLVDARHGTEEVKAALAHKLLGQGPLKRLPPKVPKVPKVPKAAPSPYRYVRYAPSVSATERLAELKAVSRTLHPPDVLAGVPVRDEIDSVVRSFGSVDTAYKLDVPRWRAAYHGRMLQTKATGECRRDFSGEHDVWVACPADVNPPELRSGARAADSLRRKTVWPSARTGWAGTGVYFTTDAKAAAGGSQCVLRCRVNLSSGVAVRGDVRDGMHWSICAKSYRDFVPLYVVFLHKA